jgi:hypothetical protein
MRVRTDVTGKYWGPPVNEEQGTVMSLTGGAGGGVLRSRRAQEREEWALDLRIAASFPRFE